MKRSDVRSDSAAGMPTGSVPAGGAAVAAAPTLSSPAEPVPPVGPVLAVEGVLSVLCGARDVVAGASRVPLGDVGWDTLVDVVDVASRLRCAADALVLSATAALEAARPGSGRCALVGRARMSKRGCVRCSV